TNTKKTLYLTATVGRTDFKENNLYNKIFSNVPNFFCAKEKSDNHINMMVLKYNSNPSPLDIMNCRNPRGFDSIKYMMYSTEGKGKAKYFNALFTVFDSIIEDLVNREFKIVVMALKITAVNIIHKE